MDPSTQLSLFNAWRHPAMGGMAGMDITQAAYRYNQNMMEYYTCKSKSLSDSSITTHVSVSHSVTLILLHK